MSENRSSATLRDRVEAARVVDRVTPGWSFDASCSQAAEVVAEAPAGADLLSVLEAEVDGLRTPDEGLLVELIAAAERIVNRAGALQAAFVAELMERRIGSRGATRTRDEIALRLASTGHAAETLVGRAAALAEAPAVAETFREGLLTARKVDLIAEATEGMEPTAALRVQEHGAAYGQDHTPPQLRRELEVAVLAVDPAGAQRESEKERARRRVVLEPARHEMAWVGAYVPAAEALAAYTCVDTLAADTTAEDERTLDQRRADVFVQIFQEILVTGHTPGGHVLGERHGRRPVIQISATVPVLAADDETPAMLHGYGPISAGSARRLAGGGTVEVDVRDRGRPQGSAPTLEELLDPMREVLPPRRPPGLPDGSEPAATVAWMQRRPPGGVAQSPDAAAAGVPRVGPSPPGRGSGATDPVVVMGAELGLACTDSYVPSRRLRALILDRDRTCCFPGCLVPAWRCQIDHITPFDPALPPWAQTVETNLQTLCRHHHQGKTERAFSVERDAWTGVTTWRTRTGHVYVRVPERSDFTALSAGLREEVAPGWSSAGQ
ncbi:HNH endonuclease [Ruania suaedae]|uniref:HNH endonuclease signature motif containing protein n=1 Tax=Ruania suaedae TaxID=2897774 RepID=UPI001E5BD010|nr:HNH endonuclease signature motif containing protein [Ruania suaedae]UFU01553.1 HNH endonuclease [Ruania suaedae]